MHARGVQILEIQALGKQALEAPNPYALRIQYWRYRHSCLSGVRYRYVPYLKYWRYRHRGFKQTPEMHAYYTCCRRWLRCTQRSGGRIPAPPCTAVSPRCTCLRHSMRIDTHVPNNTQRTAVSPRCACLPGAGVDPRRVHKPASVPCCPSEEAPVLNPRRVHKPASEGLFTPSTLFRRRKSRNPKGITNKD